MLQRISALIKTCLLNLVKRRLVITSLQVTYVEVILDCSDLRDFGGYGAIEHGRLEELLKHCSIDLAFEP